MNRKWMKYSLAALVTIGSSWGYYNVVASDHDDGSQAAAQNNLNLTDLFVFREDNQTGNASDKGNLVLVMDSNGHTTPGQQIFFNTRGYYDFHISRVAASAVNTSPTGANDVAIRFQFSEPDASSHQTITASLVSNGSTVGMTNTNGASASLFTTSLADGKANQPKVNSMSVGGQTVSVFAGLREDPFFFDVEQFFKVRAGALGTGPVVGFRDPAQAVDGFAKQNINSIVVRVPLALLQTSAEEPVFDVWETTSKF